MKDEKYFWRIGTIIVAGIAAALIPEPNIRESIFLSTNNANAAGPEGCLNSNGKTCHPKNTTTGSGWYCGRDTGGMTWSKKGYETRAAQQCFLNNIINRSDLSPISPATPIPLVSLSPQSSTTITSCHPEFQYVDEKGQKSGAQFKVIIPVGKSSHGFRCNSDGSVSPIQEAKSQAPSPIATFEPIPTREPTPQTLARNPNNPNGGSIYAYPPNHIGEISFLGTLMCIKDKAAQAIFNRKFITTARCF